MRRIIRYLAWAFGLQVLFYSPAVLATPVHVNVTGDDWNISGFGSAVSETFTLSDHVSGTFEEGSTATITIKIKNLSTSIHHDWTDFHFSWNVDQGDAPTVTVNTGLFDASQTHVTSTSADVYTNAGVAIDNGEFFTVKFENFALNSSGIEITGHPTIPEPPSLLLWSMGLVVLGFAGLKS